MISKGFPKPSIGDIFTMIDVFAADPAPHEKMETCEVKVLAVFDSLNEDWGDYGHEAMGQYDVDGHVGRDGDWYAVVRFADDENETQGTWSCASYEAVK
jgi:hypothetical protein